VFRMSWIDRALARENEILRIIKSFVKSKLEFILVGGYAVSALARQRFSVDCDVVIPKDLAKPGSMKHMVESLRASEKKLETCQLRSTC